MEKSGSLLMVGKFSMHATTEIKKSESLSVSQYMLESLEFTPKAGTAT